MAIVVPRRTRASSSARRSSGCSSSATRCCAQVAITSVRLLGRDRAVGVRDEPRIGRGFDAPRAMHVARALTFELELEQRPVRLAALRPPSAPVPMRRSACRRSVSGCGSGCSPASAHTRLAGRACSPDPTACAVDALSVQGRRGAASSKTIRVAAATRSPASPRSISARARSAQSGREDDRRARTRRGRRWPSASISTTTSSVSRWTSPAITKGSAERPALRPVQATAAGAEGRVPVLPLSFSASPMPAGRLMGIGESDKGRSAVAKSSTGGCGCACRCRRGHRSASSRAGDRCSPSLASAAS